MAFALTGAKIFDGAAFHDGLAVVVDGRYITHVVQADKLGADISQVPLSGGLLAPGFIDVQVNGGGGALLNDNPSIDTVRRIADAHRRFGTVGLLPTVITDAPYITNAAIAAVREARGAGMANILGIHVEGPFLDAARKGAHAAQYIRGLTAVDIRQLAEADCGKLMLTLAPNRVTARDVSKLTNAGILVSLGHSDATYVEVRAALEAGATSFTHLFNAMSQLAGREPGMVGAALSDSNSYLGVIADGHHVHDASLRLAFAASSLDRFMLVSDAMTSAAGGPAEFELQGRSVSRVGNRLTLADGTLAGSDITMDAAVRYCVERLNLDLADALRMASANPARFLGLHEELGLIAPGALASLVHLDDTLHVTQTWIEGQ
jgi:N-acetylglucosamine-6-phosphate deacetylase